MARRTSLDARERVEGQLELPFEDVSSEELVDAMATKLVELFEPEELWARITSGLRGRGRTS
jgi:hypothetical protein